MKLYHGTSVKHLDSILSEGIKPRGDEPSTWAWSEGTPTSNAKCVYLAETLPVYYAINAVEKEDMLVLEVDMDMLPTSMLYPDEDFVWESAKGKFGSHAEIVEKLGDFKHHYGDSLDYLGSVAYMGTVAPECITRYATLKYDGFWLMSFDQSSSMMAYKILSDHYKQKLEWIFGDSIEYPVNYMKHTKPDEEQLSKMPPEARLSIERMFMDQDEHNESMRMTRDKLVTVVDCSKVGV